MRNIARSHEAIRQGRWVTEFGDAQSCFELSQKTIGLIGFGDIAKHVARKLAAFDMKVVAYDPFVPQDIMLSMGVQKLALPQLLAESDVVSVHAALNDSTRGLIGANEIALMKPTSYLINTARAAIVDREALYHALSAKAIAGAAIDVFWSEPVDPSDPMLHLDNVTVTPHLAGATHDALAGSLGKLHKRLQPHLRKLSDVTGSGGNLA